MNTQRIWGGGPRFQYEVPSFLGDANLATYMLNFGDIVSATHDGMRREWRFDIILDVKTYSIPNWLDVEGRRLPIIVSGRKPACWHCGEIVTSPQFAQGRRPEKARPKPLYPLSCRCEWRKGGSCSLAHSQSNGPRIGWEAIPHSPFVFDGYHRRVKGGVAEGKVGRRSNLRVLNPESCLRWTPTVHPPHKLNPRTPVPLHPLKLMPKLQISRSLDTYPKQPTPSKGQVL